MSIYSWIIYPIIFIFPAYVANGAPVVFGGGRAIDGGAMLGGKPILGPNKTIRGLIAGILAGSFIAFVESFFMPSLLLSGIAMSFGAHFGDLLGSFIKRRMGTKSGANVFFLDQYLFVVFALVFAYPFGNFLSLVGVVFILVLSGFLHVLANTIAHRLKLKSVPW